MIIKREIGEKGQVVIPKDIREFLDLKIREKIVFEIKDEIVIIKKEMDPKEIVEEFFNTRKIQKKLSVKSIKKLWCVKEI